MNRVNSPDAVAVIPAHNEAARLRRCVRSVLAAAAEVPGQVVTVVVLDACTDGSAQIVRRFGSTVHALSIDARNVGAARAAGFAYARDMLAANVAGRCWYATTDADSCVDSDWLVRQMAAGADMVLGVVRIGNWRHIPTSVARRYMRRYRFRPDEDSPAHGHIHGANMGFSAEAYWEVGGFAALSSGEDVDLVDGFTRRGYRVRYDSALSVVTSARPDGRAPNGFAAHLRSMLHRSTAEEPA